MVVKYEGLKQTSGLALRILDGRQRWSAWI